MKYKINMFNHQIRSKYIKSSQNLENFNKSFNAGNYEDLIKKLNIYLKNKSENDQLIFLRKKLP